MAATQVVLEWRDGICNVIVDERPDLVYVRVLGCHPKDPADAPRDPDRSREDLDSPRRVYLDAPLGERIVVDVDSGEPLPMYIPRWVPANGSFYIRRPPGILSPQRRKTTTQHKGAICTPGGENVHGLGQRANAVRCEAEHPILRRD
jgi:hypothetical protein